MKKLDPVSIEVAKRVLKVVDRGLSHGVGDRKPGQMCVEAAVCYAMGESHGDEPSCVDFSVRDFKIFLNDQAWPSKAARARGLRRVAIAQLGSNKIKSLVFTRELYYGVCMRVVFPFFKAKLAEKPSTLGNKELNRKLDKLHQAIDCCVTVGEASRILRKMNDLRSGSGEFIQALEPSRVIGLYPSLTKAENFLSLTEHMITNLLGCVNEQDYEPILAEAAEAAVEALVAAGSPGTQWLYLTEPAPKLKPSQQDLYMAAWPFPSPHRP